MQIIGAAASPKQRRRRPCGIKLGMTPPAATSISAKHPVSQVAAFRTTATRAVLIISDFQPPASAIPRKSATRVQLVARRRGRQRRTYGPAGQGQPPEARPVDFQTPGAGGTPHSVMALAGLDLPSDRLLAPPRVGQMLAKRSFFNRTLSGTRSACTSFL